MPTRKYSKAELEAWVNTWGISDEKKQSVLSTFGDDEVVGYLGEGVLSRQESDRLYREIQDEREALQANAEETAQLKSELIAWREENSPKFDSAMAELTKLQEERKVLLDAYIKAGGKLDELGKAAPLPESKAPAFDEAKFSEKFVTRDDIAKTVPALLTWPAQLLKIQQEHFKLTGEYPDGEKIIAEVIKGKSVQQAYEETHNVVALRDAQHEREIEARLEAARKEERSRVLTEMAVDPAARRDNDQVKGFMEAFSGTPDEAKLAQADAASRARAAKALEGFNPLTG